MKYNDKKGCNCFYCRHASHRRKRCNAKYATRKSRHDSKLSLKSPDYEGEKVIVGRLRNN